MTERKPYFSPLRVLVGVVILFVLGVGIWWYFESRGTWPRGEALSGALRPVIEGAGTDQSLVARVILENYLETRTDALYWSGVYWGSTFTAATVSAVAGLILKFETIVKNEGVKKDIAAFLSILAALIITISSSGDFQRKWQANRIAAAELEQTGYEFLEKNGADPRAYFATVGQALLRRNLAIVGSGEKRIQVNGGSKSAAPIK